MDRILLGFWTKEECPFRLYRGCSLVLRGERWFNREKAKDYRIPGEQGKSGRLDGLSNRKLCKVERV